MYLKVLNFIRHSLLFVTAVKRLKNTEKRRKALGFLGNPHSLDEWEVPRNRIVLNRKIGEGCFGTVYGGEALVPNKGWIPVAVKTLKAGSIFEEKVSVFFTCVNTSNFPLVKSFTSLLVCQS